MHHPLIDEYHRNPVLLRHRLTALARLERSRAMGGAIVALFGALGRLFDHVKARLTSRPHRWIERLG